MDSGGWSSSAGDQDAYDDWANALASTPAIPSSLVDGTGSDTNERTGTNNATLITISPKDSSNLDHVFGHILHAQSDSQSPPIETIEEPRIEVAAYNQHPVIQSLPTHPSALDSAAGPQHLHERYTGDSQAQAQTSDSVPVEATPEDQEWNHDTGGSASTISQEQNHLHHGESGPYDTDDGNELHAATNTIPSSTDNPFDDALTVPVDDVEDAEPVINVIRMHQEALQEESLERDLSWMVTDEPGPTSTLGSQFLAGNPGQMEQDYTDSDNAEATLSEAQAFPTQFEVAQAHDDVGPALDSDSLPIHNDNDNPNDPAHEEPNQDDDWSQRMNLENNANTAENAAPTFTENTGGNQPLSVNTQDDEASREIESDWMRMEGDGAGLFNGANATGEQDIMPDTDWLKDESAEELADIKADQPLATEPPTRSHTDTAISSDTNVAPNVEDSWAQALGDPDKLDDTWGAAFADDDEGFLEDDAALLTVSNPVSSALPVASATARSTSQYAPSGASISPTTTQMPTQSPFASVTSPFGNAYSTTAAVPTSTISRPSTAAPMQFFEDLPSTRPPPVRRPKQQVVAVTPPLGPTPPGTAMPPPGVRPAPPPRTSSAAYPSYGEFKPPEKMNPFPPQSDPNAQVINGQSTQLTTNGYVPVQAQSSAQGVPSRPPPTSTSSRYTVPQSVPVSGQRSQSPYAPAPAATPQNLPPVTPDMTQRNTFMASPPKPQPGASSKYSPSAATGQMSSGPGAEVSTARPAPPQLANRFVPRTSSPLAAPNQRPTLNRYASATVFPADQSRTVVPPASAAGLLSPTNPYAPPPASTARPPALAALRPPGGPRILERSVSFMNPPSQLQMPQDGFVFEPPRRPRTSSPVHARERPQSSTNGLERTAIFSPTSSSQQSFPAPPSTTIEHEVHDYVLPDNETAADPLQRWRGTSIFKWGAGGLAVSSIPKHIPRYGGGQSAPKLKPVSGEIRLRKVKDVLVEDDGVSTFPGPLKSKGKKRDVVTWLSTRITVLEQHASKQAGMPKNAEEKLLLWKVMRILVEHDGVLAGNPAVTAAVSELLVSVVEPRQIPDAVEAASLPSVHSSTVTSATVSEIRAHLLAGEREKAVWHAVDNKMWGHALIISSTTNNDLWKQVVQEFVRKQVRASSSQDNRSLAALYEVFAGNWGESIDQLVPLAARQGFQMVNAADKQGQAQDTAEGLEKWRETLSLVVHNRSNGDENGLVALGKLLISYGRVEAAHVCYLFARSVAIFGGADDAQSHFSLLGVDLTSESSPKVVDTDAILLTEVYEFALSLAPAAPTFFPPHLQAHKLQHAYLLTELGLRSEAQQYCDSIASALKSSTRGSPYYHPLFVNAIDDLSKRLSQSPQTSGSSWMSKITKDKVSSNVWSKFNKFVAGDETDGSTQGLAGSSTEAGPFNGTPTPTISRSPSVADFTTSGITQAAQAMGGGRYAPSAYGTSPEQNRSHLNTYAPYGASPEAGLKSFERRFSSDSPPIAYGSPPRAPPFQRQVSTLSRYSSHESASAYDARVPPSSMPYEANIASVPEGSAVEHSSYPNSRRTSAIGSQPSRSYLPSAPTTPSYDDARAAPSFSNRYSGSSATSDQRPSSSRYDTNVPNNDHPAGYMPTSSAPSFGYEPSADSETTAVADELSGYMASAPVDVDNTGDDAAIGNEPYSYGYQPSASIAETSDDVPSAAEEDSTPADSGYQPSDGYMPGGGYAPPEGGYVPYEPGMAEDAQVEEDDAPRPKKKGIMDLDDDDDFLVQQAQNLKKQQQTSSKSKADREADELVRKAAEADGKSF